MAAQVEAAPMTVVNLLTGATTTVTGPVVAMRGATPRIVMAKVTGTGLVSATVEIYGRVGDGGSKLLMTFPLSGTTSDNDAGAIEAPWPEIWAVVTAISGTGAAVTVTTGY